MAVTVAGTSITFNDGTVQTTAGGTPSSGGIGAVQMFWLTRSLSFFVGDTISGSYLFTPTSSTGFGGVKPNYYPFNGINNSGQSFSFYNRTTAFTFVNGGNTVTFSPAAGTWRFVSTAPACYISKEANMNGCLAVRIA